MFLENKKENLASFVGICKRYNNVGGGYNALGKIITGKLKIKIPKKVLFIFH
jgi:hypothetical protein